MSKELSVRDGAGAEVAVISRRGLSARYEILAGGQLTTVRPRGFLGQRFEIDSAAGLLEARGNFSGRQYSVTRGVVQAGGSVVAVDWDARFVEQGGAFLGHVREAAIWLEV